MAGRAREDFGESFAASAIRAWRDSTAENYGGHLRRLAKVAKEEPGHSARFVVRVFLLWLAREVTTDSSIKGAVAAVRALEKLEWLPPTISATEHLLIKAISQVNPGAGSGVLQWGAPDIFKVMAGAASSALDWEFVAISTIATGARLRVREALTILPDKWLPSRLQCYGKKSRRGW